MSQNNNQETTIKTLGIVSLAVIIFALLYNSLLGGNRGFGFQMNYGMGHGRGYGMNYGMNYGMGYGYGVGGAQDINGIFASLFSLAVNLLWLVFVGALLAGVFILVKKYLNENKVDLSFATKIYQSAGSQCPTCGAKVSDDFKYCPGCQSSLRETCAGCGREMLPGWKCCPSCGKEREEAAAQQA